MEPSSNNVKLEMGFRMKQSEPSTTAVSYNIILEFSNQNLNIQTEQKLMKEVNHSVAKLGESIDWTMH